MHTFTELERNVFVLNGSRFNSLKHYLSINTFSLGDASSRLLQMKHTQIRQLLGIIIFHSSRLSELCIHVDESKEKYLYSMVPNSITNYLKHCLPIKEAGGNVLYPFGTAREFIASHGRCN